MIEHVGTTDGHADRRPDYHEVRRQWVQEIFRILMPGGHMLLAGPNRGFPIDVAHGLEERILSGWLGVSVHKTWGSNFQWGYADFHLYLSEHSYSVMPLSIASYVHYSRVPGLLRSLVKSYVDRLPAYLLGTGFNPWTAALIRKNPSLLPSQTNKHG